MEAYHGAAVCIFIQLLAISSASNIDIRQPIRRRLPSPDNQQTDGLFGFSLVLHQTGATESRSEALANTRIVVSAPRLTVPGGVVNRTGAVYTCPIIPGFCSPLMGDGTDDDRRLYDLDADGEEESKIDQFLGGSMASNGENFIVCAHRFGNRRSVNLALPVGRCYATTDQSLQNFRALQPCPVPNTRDTLDVGSAGICLAGTSSVITVNNGEAVFGIGAPGYFSLAGVMIRVENGVSQRQGVGIGSNRDSYQGYAIAVGNFRSTDQQDFAVSVPKLMNYFGIVNIVQNDAGLAVVSQPDLRGQQMGEYYGFSLLQANLIGDDLDELLVGAPMYRANATEPETGRVFVYENVQGSLVFRSTIEGFTRFSRFGYAMANLGDINGDGFDDVAISAPFTENASGTVYIYHSASGTLLTSAPQQEIVGSDLPLTQSLTSLRGFGTSLASGVDVDGNGFDDLAIGSFLSQEVFLLRTRPLARVTQTLSATPQIIDVRAQTCAGNLACFNVSACASYTGTGVADDLSFQFSVTADARNLERRIALGDPNDRSGMVVRSVPVMRDNPEECLVLTAYIIDGILDVFNAFQIDFRVELPEVTIPQSDGNPVPRNLEDIPILATSGATTVAVETLKDCGDDGQCVPDLAIQLRSYRLSFVNGNQQTVDVQSTPQDIILGNVQDIFVLATVTNSDEDAFQATITITAPTQYLEIGRVNGALNNNRALALSCPMDQRTRVMIDGVENTRANCSIGNPFRGVSASRPSGDTIELVITLSPRNNVLLNAQEVIASLGFRVQSVNNEANIEDGTNEATGSLRITAQADIMLDSGIVSPEVISYSNNPVNGSIVNATQLGPTFSTTFLVRNLGPSTVRSIGLTINWPVTIASPHFLYPAIITPFADAGATMTCMSTNVNPAGLGLLDIESQDEQNTQQGIGEGGKRRRRRRNAISIHREEGRRLLKRQTNTASISVDRVVTCESGEVMCLPIQCEVRTLQAGSTARVEITGFLDERSFSDSTDRFRIVPFANISINQGSFITELNVEDGMMAEANVNVIPADAPTTRESSSPVPWWAIFLPILAAVIIIVIVGAALWGLGFFKRRKHEELKQRREELENLNNNGSGPGADEGTNM